jgi:hypothetical protein
MTQIKAMSEADPAATEKTHRAIGRFIFEFSQVEYTIRVYMAEEIGLKDEHFNAVAMALDVALLCNVTKKVFENSPAADRIKTAINKFLEINAVRTRVAHGLWVPFEEGGSVHHVSRTTREPCWDRGQANELEMLSDKLNALRMELEDAFWTLRRISF